MNIFFQINFRSSRIISLSHRKLYLIRRLVAEHGLNVTQRLLHKEEGARVKRQKQSDEVRPLLHRLALL